MNKPRQWLGYLGGALILATVFWLGQIALDAFLQSSATVRLGVLTATISVITIVYNNSRQQSREIQSRQFSDKRDAYRKVFDFLFDVMHASTSDIALEESEIMLKSQSITKDLMIWGSSDTINSYNLFMRNSINTSADLLHQFNNVEALLRSFRKDLGHDDRRLERLGLSKLLIKAEEHHNLDNLK